MGIQLTGRREDTDIVLTDEIADKLRVHLPRRYRLAPEMALLYSLDQHGISLSTLYHLVKNNKGPCVLVIKDADNNIFGAYLNESLKPGTRYYGTGECFLWKWQTPECQITAYKWTGKNDYMILSEPDFIAIGGGEGVFGLWINSELEKGYSQSCPTFDNERLTPRPEFECIELEIWGFRI
ncbi:TLD-domain-containing protein [Rhizopus microsporus var. microsporus]|uniref:Oxidation resistance protein 1 n=2 Tax=Rhizopus microsporus TaxID=58291 RepID=A0A1X0QW85_RHIZD|nr:TLD-domain-containing protein [Rhizopus microsporus var. microsporus]